jgi:hypothetical protein
LSAAVPGLTVSTRPALGVLVGQWLAEYKTLVLQPSPSANPGGHTHYRFKLYATPAGTTNNPVFMDRHCILLSDPTLPGWLPADHAVFGGTAPEGAKFGYNLAKHHELFKVYPPAPLESAHVEAYLDGAGGGREMGRVVRLTASGIWWMRDDWGWAPWQLDFTNLSTDTGAVVTTPETPPPIELQHGPGYVTEDGSSNCPFSLILWFSRPTQHTENAVVASLEAKAPITITDCNGKPATTGRLIVGLDWKLATDDTGTPGCMVVKEFDGTTIKRGKVMTGLRSDSDLVQLVSPDGEAPDEDGYLPGRVLLRYQDPNGTARELEVSLFALDGATEEKYADLFYLGFPNGRRSAVRGRVEIPETGVPKDMFDVSLKLRLLGTASGDLPALQFSYRRLPVSANPAALPTASSEVTLASVPSNIRLNSANLYFDVITAPMRARAGDTLVFTLQRGQEGYPGIVGVARARGVIG